MWDDLRFTFRTLARAPLFTFTAIAAMALGIGSTAAIFSVINGVLLRPLSWPQPERLVQFYLSTAAGDNFTSSPSRFNVLRDHAGAFEAIGAYEPKGTPRSLRGEAPEQVNTLRVTSGYFRVLGARFEKGPGVC